VYIESPQNSRIRSFSQLKTKKGRAEQGLFIVEGFRLIEEVLESDIEIEAVLWDVGTDELQSHIANHEKVRGHFLELSPDAFAAVADTVTPQGAIVIAKIPTPGKHPLAEQVVLLDGMQDPGNVGTILRTCDAFGIGGVCCGTGTVDPYSPKVVRASMGGLFRLNVQSADSERFVENWTKLHPGGQVIVSAAHGDTLCYETVLSGPYLLVIGSEAQGVRPSVSEHATTRVSIPMQGDAESLNAGVAGSILLYEAFRQKQKTP